MNEQPTARRKPLHLRILLGLLIGVVAGLTARQIATIVPGSQESAAVDANNNGIHDRLDWFVANIAEPCGKIFLRLIFMVVVPLVVAALTLGVFGLGHGNQLGRIGLRTLVFTVVFSMSAVGIGVLLVNAIRPGGGLSAVQANALRAQYSGRTEDLVRKAKAAKSLKDTLLDVIPENPLQEMVGAVDGSSKGNGMLSVMLFALAFGAALTLAPKDSTAALVQVLEAVFQACMAIIGFAMRLAPYAVACLVFSIVSLLGFDILKTLIWFVVTVTAGLAIQLLVVYPIAIRVFARMSPVFFFRGVREAMLTAFGTSSSNATLPTAIRVAREGLHLPGGIANFVLTVGATGNQNGTALFEGVVVLFLAQVFGVELTTGQQITVVAMSILAGIGTAGVPGGSLPLIVIVMQSVGVPAEGIGIILGVDRILDMCRTVINVTGDLAVAACVARGEKSD